MCGFAFQSRWIEPAESYPGEYFAYLKNYIDGKVVFSADSSSKLPGIHEASAAFDFAIQRELDRILYYQELRAFVPEKDSRLIDEVIAEERKHFALLSEAEKNHK
jgi:hypothetical protein